MTSIASLDHTPLLELRTPAGAVYLRPSRLQRMRLRWLFRHFHSIPAQVLSRHDQRLIEQLCRSAVVNPSPGDAILGVIEAAQVYAFEDAPRAGWSPRGVWAFRWALLGAMAVAGIAITLAGARILLHRSASIPVAHASTEYQPELVQPAVATELLTVTPAITPAVVKLRPLAEGHPVATVASLIPAVVDAPISAARWITELPRDHFVRPVVARGSPSGEVELNALIAPDGSVQRVAAVSGDRQLAEAGIRAVRQWHYSPSAAEEATRIKMNFFGSDAVSIGSIAVSP